MICFLLSEPAKAYHNLSKKLDHKFLIFLLQGSGYCGVVLVSLSWWLSQYSIYR